MGLVKEDNYVVDTTEKSIFLTDRGFKFSDETLCNVHNLYEQLQMTNKIMNKNNGLSSTEAWNLAGTVRNSMNKVIDNFIKETNLEEVTINEAVSEYMSRDDIELD